MIGKENINPILITLGKRIRALRKEQGLSQEKFSQMAEIDRSYLISIEHGERKVSIDILARISNGLGMTLSELFEGIG